MRRVFTRYRELRFGQRLERQRIVDRHRRVDHATRRNHLRERSRRLISWGGGDDQHVAFRTAGQVES